MRFTTIFFDLDDTLYPSSSGLWQAIRDRMNLYMQERLGIPPEEVPALRRHYFETYGTTLRGLQRYHQVDPEDFLAYVHDLHLPSFIQPNSEVRDLIASLPLKRWIFTNADDKHALRVLKELQLEGCFEGIIDIRAVEWACKPEQAAYLAAMRIAGETDASRCVLLDDSPRNLAPARDMGIFTVLVGAAEPMPKPDLHIGSLLDLRHKLPELWISGKK